MAGKEVFNEDISEVAKFDDALDVNAILATPPTSVTEEEEEHEQEEDKEKNKDNTLDVNKALASQETEEEQEDDEETEVEAPDHSTNTNDSSSDAPFTVVFARDLNDRGLLTSFDEEAYQKDIEELGEAEALRKLIQGEVNVNVTQAKKEFDEGYQEYLRMLEGGVPQEQANSLVELKKYFGGIKPEELESDDNEELRKSVITQYYQLTTQMSDEKIKKLIDRSIDLGDDVEESKDFLNTLNTLVKNKIEESEQSAQETRRLQEEENRKQLEVLKENIDTIGEIIPGQKVNKQTKDKMYEAITKPVKDKFGNVTNSIWARRAEDPVFFDSRLSYLLETGFFEKGKTWDKIKKVKTTKEASELDEFISKNTSSRTGRLSTKEVSNDDIRKLIESTESIL